jgi:hypothetical protein
VIAYAYPSDSAVTGSAIFNRRGAVRVPKGSSEGEDGGEELSDEDVSDSSRFARVFMYGCVYLYLSCGRDVSLAVIYITKML